MFIYDYNSSLHKYKEVHDETGGRLKELSFQYYDCCCGHTGYKIVSSTTRHHNQFTVVQCGKCGTLRINPYLTDAAIETYYKEIYGPVKRKNMTAEALFARQSRSANDLLQVIKPLAGKEAMILDYGSGAGGRMTALKADGYTNVHLFDYDKKYLEYGVSQGFKAHQDGNRYDMITLSHVLEHVNMPAEFLQKLAKDYLKPDGKIYIEVPMFDNHVKLIGDFHLAHKFYFTQKSLIILAALSGFSKVHEEEDVLVITPSSTAIVVPEAGYAKALADSNALLKKARSKSRSISRKLAIKRMLSSRS